MNVLKLLINYARQAGKKGINTDILVIILLVLGLAISIIVFLLLSSQGQLFLGNLTKLSIAPP